MFYKFFHFLTRQLPFLRAAYRSIWCCSVTKMVKRRLQRPILIRKGVINYGFVCSECWQRSSSVAPYCVIGIDAWGTTWEKIAQEHV